MIESFSIEIVSDLFYVNVNQSQYPSFPSVRCVS